MLARSGRGSREPGEKILAMLESPYRGQLNIPYRWAEKLMQHLGGDKDQQAAAETMARKLSQEQLESMLKIMDTNKDAAKLLMSWIGSEEMEKRVAAKALLDVKAYEYFKGASEKLEKMLADPAQVERAQAILSLDNPQQIAKLIELREQKVSEKGAEEIVKMLASKTDSDKRAAQRLLQMFDYDNDSREPILRARDGARGGFDNSKTAERMLRMLGSGEQATMAKLMLAHCEDSQQRKGLLELYERDITTGARLLNYIAKKSVPDLEDLPFGRPERINKYLDILETSGAASRLGHVLGSRGVNDLLALLTSDTKDEKELGDKMLKDLSESKAFNPLTAQILNVQMTTQERQQLMTLMADRDRRIAGQVLFQAIQNPAERAGAEALLSMLRSKEPALKQSGDQLFNRLNDLKEQGNVRAVMSLGGNPKQMKILSEMLGDERAKPSAELLIAMMRSSDQRQAAARGLLEMIATKPEFREGFQFGEQRSSADAYASFRKAHAIIELLISKDAKQQQLGNNIVDYLNGPEQYQKFMELTGKRIAETPEQKVAADKLLAMMSSADVSQIRGAANLIALLTERGEASVQKILEMLGKEDQQADAEAILTQLASSDNVREFGKLMVDTKYATVRKMLMGMLRSGDAAQARSVSALMGSMRDRSDRISSPFEQAEPERSIRSLLDKLSKSETAEFAKQTLLLAQTPEALVAQARMLETPAGQKTLKRLMEMAKNKDQKDMALTILSATLTPESAGELLKLFDDSKLKAGVLLEMLRDDDGGKAFAGTEILRLLARGDLDQKAGAEKLLDMLVDPVKHEIAEKMMLSLSPSRWPLMMQVLTEKATEVLAKSLIELMESENQEDVRSVAILMRMLETESQKKEGVRLFSMLNTERHRHEAIRILRDRSAGFSFNN